MAEITANFGGKDITITYPDTLLGKAQEAFPIVNNVQWASEVSDKKEELVVDSLTEEQESELKYEFTIKCIMNYVTEAIKISELKLARQTLESNVSEQVENDLSQINMDIQ